MSRPVKLCLSTKGHFSSSELTLLMSSFVEPFIENGFSQDLQLLNQLNSPDFINTCRPTSSHFLAVTWRGAPLLRSLKDALYKISE